jgi:hypothetical protein
MGHPSMNKLKPYLVTAGVVIVVLAILTRVVPYSIRSAVLGSTAGN